jgi:RNA polymerase sigma factor (sigma-70 family)
MKTAIENSPKPGVLPWIAVPFIYHDSFPEPAAERAYAGTHVQDNDSMGFLSDDSTRDWARRMHYAGWRTCTATTRREASRWRRSYFECRDRVVLGNRKLTFRAVRKWGPPVQFADDMAAECQIVLIKAVAAFNPWLNIRFSTYAFTCLMRALSRLAQRLAHDRLSRALPLECLPFGEPSNPRQQGPAEPGFDVLQEYFRAEHELLTPREKSVLLRRYPLHNPALKTETLAQVGRDLGLSKERVRQVQFSALDKLRAALLPAGPRC